MSFFHVIDQHAARHPVARAAAKARLRTTLRDFQIQLHLLPDGSEQVAALVQALQILQVAAVAAEMRHDATPGRLPVIRGALSACFDRLEQRGTWRTSVAVAIDRGLTEALAALNDATALEVQRAWVAVERMQDEALQPHAAPREQHQPLEHLRDGPASPGQLACIHPATMPQPDVVPR